MLQKDQFMFVLKKIVTSFLLPPGLFIIFSIVMGGRYVFQKKTKTGAMLLAFGCCMWILAITPVSNSLLRGLEADVVLPVQINGDVLILLGGGTYDRAPDLSGVGAPGEETLARIVAAFRLHRRLQLPIIVSGGKGYRHVDAEAPIIRRLLIDLGVPAAQIITEDKSRDTFENAVFTKRYCETHNFKRPIVITSAYHIKRTLISFEKAGMQVTPFPSLFRSWEKRRYGWYDYLPGAFGLTQIAMKEYLGIVYTKLFP